jgi:uncharacterized linocin/CFP29 family protein
VGPENENEDNRSDYLIVINDKRYGVLNSKRDVNYNRKHIKSLNSFDIYDTLILNLLEEPVMICCVLRVMVLNQVKILPS